ncbi:hypothetical protein HN51_002842 [Arachis hypogaea]
MADSTTTLYTTTEPYFPFTSKIHHPKLFQPLTQLPLYLFFFFNIFSFNTYRNSLNLQFFLLFFLSCENPNTIEVRDL